MFVVAGASGNTGSVVADTLLVRGEKVRLIARDPARVARFAARGAEVVPADLDDVEKVAAALRGPDVKGAYLLLPPLYTSTDPRKDYGRRTEALFRAVEESRVPHVVLLSSIGSHLTSGTGPILTTHDLETRFASARAAVTFLRPAAFVENFASSFGALAGGLFPTFYAADKAIEVVSAGDIGRIAAEALVQKPALRAGAREILELSGPRAVSPRDVAASLTRLLGRPVEVQQGPESAIVGALTQHGMSAAVAEAIHEMTVTMNAGRLVFQGGTARHLRGAIDLDDALRPLLPAVK
jgi:uncharacterized protein YbjT (DUF2867 family)